MNEIAQQVQKTQRDLNQAMVERQQLEVQFHESRIVKEEFDGLSDEAKIFKLIGPVLVPQDKLEADSNVAKRLEFIESQKSQAEIRIQKLQDELNEMQVKFREQQIKAAVDAKTS